MNFIEHWTQSFEATRSIIDEITKSPDFIENCTQFSQLLVETVESDGNVFTCGNGGSHCDSMHFAEELTGRYRGNRRPLGAMALGDASHTTCTANDFGFEHVFARQVQGLGRQGDLLIGISTSGNSQNVINAIDAAKTKGLKTVCLLGKDGGKLKGQADVSIVVPAQTPERIQEVHIKLIHMVIESMERQLFPEYYN